MPLDPTLISLLRTNLTEYHTYREIINIPDMIGKKLSDIYKMYPNLSYTEHSIFRKLLREELICQLKTIMLMYGHDDFDDLESIMNTPELLEWIENWRKQSIYKLKEVDAKSLYQVVMKGHVEL